jgi:ethanolamine utilization microcompartment shell protein EutL
MSLML